jgi:hypothetical protein
MAEQEKDPLFPALPEDLKSLTDAEVQQLLDDHVSAAALIDADDEEFLAGLSADEIIAQYAAGVEAVKTLQTENKARLAAYEEYKAEKERLKAELSADDEGDDSGDGDDAGDEAEATEETVEVTAEAAPDTSEETDEAPVEEPVPVTASAPPAPRFSRTPPAPARERIVVTEEKVGTALVASGGYREQYTGPLDAVSLAQLQKEAATDHGPIEHDGRVTRVKGPHGAAEFPGVKVKTAKADFEFPGDRELTGGEDDFDKIRAAMPPTVSILGQRGTMGQEALTASGGLCAPLTPIYTMPNFATEAEPVWDSLPVFRAARGGVNVPTPTYIADITSAISSISEADDAAGGTFATKSCQDLTCPEYTETAVQILAHCREYGNLNARAWPEKIAHENALTMAALSRTSEGFILDRIKSFFPNVTNGATTLGSLIFVVEAIVQARFGIIGRLRMPRETRFRALLPYWVPDMLALDTVQNQFDRFRSEASLVDYLRGLYIDPVFYLDTPSTGTTQLPDSSQTAAAQDELPADVQWAIYPEGAVLGVDSGTLELGIVRDSTLNSTNDFQVFGERFRNVALLAPAQAGMWVTTTYCANGNFPPAGTSIDCPS